MKAAHRTQSAKKPLERAFTLVELLVVIATFRHRMSATPTFYLETVRCG